MVLLLGVFATVLEVLRIGLPYFVCLIVDLLPLGSHSGDSLWSGPPVDGLDHLRLSSVSVDDFMTGRLQGTTYARSVSIQVRMLVRIVLYVTHAISFVPMVLLNQDDQEILVYEADQVTGDVEHWVRVERLL